MADRVALLNSGRLVQISSPQEVRPAVDLWAASSPAVVRCWMFLGGPTVRRLEFGSGEAFQQVLRCAVLFGMKCRRVTSSRDMRAG